MQENVTYTVVVPAEVDTLIRKRWSNPEAYLADLIASNATDQKRKQAALETTPVESAEVTVTSDAPEAQAGAARAADEAVGAERA